MTERMKACPTYKSGACDVTECPCHDEHDKNDACSNECRWFPRQGACEPVNDYAAMLRDVVPMLLHLQDLLTGNDRVHTPKGKRMLAETVQAKREQIMEAIK